MDAAHKRRWRRPPEAGGPLTPDEIDRSGGQIVRQEPDRIQLIMDEESPFGAMRRLLRRFRRRPGYAPRR